MSRRSISNSGFMVDQILKVQSPRSNTDLASSDLARLENGYAVSVNQFSTTQIGDSPLESILEGRCVVLALSPGSRATSTSHLKAILQWLAVRVGKIVVLDGNWFRRWNYMAFRRIPLEEATLRALADVDQLRRKIFAVSSNLGLADRISYLPWPATQERPEVQLIRQALLAAAASDSTFWGQVNAVVDEYVERASARNVAIGLDDSGRELLVNYVIEEVSVLIYLARCVTPVEVYPGQDLPLMQSIVAGQFHSVLPFDISDRFHLSLQVKGPAVGRLKEATQSDWQAIEAIMRGWPTHFVEEGIDAARLDFVNNQTTVFVDDERIVKGFLIWAATGSALELQWMAVDPSSCRKGIGGKILRAVLGGRSMVRRVHLQTATVDSGIPGTPFKGSAYFGTHRFFEKHGFCYGSVRPQYWGEQNHMVEMELIYDQKTRKAIR